MKLRVSHNSCGHPAPEADRLANLPADHAFRQSYRHYPYGIVARGRRSRSGQIRQILRRLECRSDEPGRALHNWRQSAHCASAL